MIDLKQTGKLGFGTAPLGNMFRDIPEDEARATVKEAWENGIRYFDTAPLYGAGLAEIRLGDALSDYPRDEFVLSTKVGRVIESETEEKQGLFADGRKNKVTDDYTAEGTLRSVEQSLERLQTDRLDYVYVHDISPDFQGDEWLAKFEEARTGAFRELTRLKEKGVIKDWGIGVNTTEPIEIALDLAEASPGINLQATRYTLLDHEHALQRLMPKAEEQSSRIVVGAPYGSGIIAGGSHYKYQDASAEVTSQVKQLNQIAERHDVSLIAAALQFSAAHPAVAAVIPGTTRPERIKQNKDALHAKIPAAFWRELREQKLISDKAPLPESE
ncbi:aldo/keto reductase [Salisediminibacterium halotolerans]|uniref:D-threo-aldose 1-dehydrogenase n=1 Tax=Salisediminibacterium halotolerans TaxID=517425 RepID=A0A1H9WEC8_9BACI|nr:aldo/keto reductase [Salisediminibacterium haloalkalitolerans]SES32195.1 D-threo-aldose 1-dehydrogenase [Salisediminibacterium haloalkalitolerans]